MDDERKPRWNRWELTPQLKIWEAVALSINIEPGSVKLRAHAWMGGGFPFDESEIFDDRLEVVLANRLNRQHFPSVYPGASEPYQCIIRQTEFIDFASQYGWTIPEEMQSLIVPVHPSPVASELSPNVIQTDAKKRLGGRPRTVQKNAQILRILIETMMSGAPTEPLNLPGDASDLLDACQRFERIKTEKLRVFSTTKNTFLKWLHAAGYSFTAGLNPASENGFWTKRCSETLPKLPPDVFVLIHNKKLVKPVRAKP